MAPSKRFIALCESIPYEDGDSTTDEFLTIATCWDVVKFDYAKPQYIYSLKLLAYYAARAIAARTDQTITQVAVHMQDLHLRKNAGYSGIGNDPWANFRHASAFGVTPYIGVLVRLSDKFQRYQNLYKDPALDQVNESIVDTLLDMACYALIAICLREENTFPDAPHKTAFFSDEL